MDTESDRRDLPSHCQHYHLSITGRLVFLAVIIMICVYSPTQMTHATFQFSPKEPYGHEITSEMETLAKETNFAPKIHANPVRNFSNGGAVSITIGTPTKDIERVHFQLVQQCVHEKDNYSPEFYLPMHHSRLPADHIYNSYYTVIGTQSPFANVYDSRGWFSLTHYHYEHTTPGYVPSHDVTIMRTVSVIAVRPWCTSSADEMQISIIAWGELELKPKFLQNCREWQPIGAQSDPVAVPIPSESYDSKSIVGEPHTIDIPKDW